MAVPTDWSSSDLPATVELLNLMAAVATFLNRNRWVELPRDFGDPSAGNVRWEMDPEGDFQTRLDGPDDVRAFTCGFLVRGFDLDEDLPLDLGRAVEADRHKSKQQVETAVAALSGRTTEVGAGLPLHRFEAELFGRLMSLGAHFAQRDFRCLTATWAQIWRSRHKRNRPVRIGVSHVREEDRVALDLRRGRRRREGDVDPGASDAVC